MARSHQQARKAKSSKRASADACESNEKKAKLSNSDATVPTDNDEPKTQFVTEKDVGITEYMNITVGFSGILKQRYSDFVVNEINVNGDVVKLTDYSLPPAEKPLIDETIQSALTDEDKHKLQTLVDTGNKKTVIDLKEENDKEKRTNLHKAIKSQYPTLDSNTDERDGGVKVITVRFKNKGQGKQRSDWPQERPNFLQFTLHKENKDTMDALDLIAKLSHIKLNVFTYGGTKDRRAKTTQLITAYRVPAQRMSDVSKTLRNIGIGNFKYVPEPLRLGQLNGNHFNIVLRDVKGKDDDINTALSSLKQHGFVNYYGMQRFGTTSIPTHHIGRALLCSNWQEAIDLILKPRPGDGAEQMEFRQVWQDTKNPRQALNKITKYNSVEKSLLVGLMKHGTNLTNALNSISRNTRLMYAHSYQSYVWNTVTSRRVKQMGYQPVIGDLVRSSKHTNTDNCDAPTVLTADNISDYTIYDVVLPQPGHDIIYPTHQAQDWYKELLDADNIDMDNMKHANKDYSLPGTYRHIASTVNDMEWSIVAYDDHTIPLILTDWEQLKGETLAPSPTDGRYKAVKLSFSLPPSTYATMALREVLLDDTSSAHQATLNPT